MCIIAIKNIGIEMPSTDTIETMWTNNPDGAGFMYAKDGKVHIEKGFMKLSEFLDRLDRLKGCFDTTATPFVLHLRITTHGGTSAENCHPFPISDNVAVLQKPVCNTDIGVAHNGIIHILPRPKISDTMEYIVSQMAYIKRADRKFYENQNLLTLIENAIDSKMALLAGDGTITTIGAFEKHGGMLYSNSSYEPRLSYSYYDTTFGSTGYYRYSAGSSTPKYVPAKRNKSYVKALMSFMDNESLDITVKDNTNGELMDMYDYAVDAKHRLYCLDWETGCAYRVHGFSVIGNVKYEADKAQTYECYSNYDDLLLGCYSCVSAPPWEQD